MPRQNIEDLGLPPHQYRVDLRTDDPCGIVKFEDSPACTKKNEQRIRKVEKAIRSGKLDRHERRKAAKLVKFLKRELKGKTVRLSAASRVGMRDFRIKTSGWLWSLIDPLDDDDWVFFTLMLPSWWVKSSELEKSAAKKLTERLRIALQRAGSGNASGWLYAMVHGEFDGSTVGFPVHIHGLATEGMVKVLRRLRKQRQFRPNTRDRSRYPKISVSRKLKIDKPWGYLPAAITYTSKSYWPQHNSLVEAGGKRSRIGKKHEIVKAKHLARCLVWLHSQPVKDQTLLVHLSTVNGKLVPGKRGDRGV